MSLRRSEVSQFTRDILAVPVEGGLLIITKLTVRYTCGFGNVEGTRTESYFYIYSYKFNYRARHFISSIL